MDDKNQNDQRITEDEFKRKLRIVISDHEGRRKKPYRCTAGKLTIGIGHNLDDNGLPDEIIDALFEYDVKVISAELHNRLPWLKDSLDVVKIVLTDMAFNLGVPRLMKFKKMLYYMEIREWIGAWQHMMDSQWKRQVPNRAYELGQMILNLSRNTRKNDTTQSR